MSILLLMLPSASFVHALDIDYGPFPPNRRPRSFPLKACVEWSRIDAQKKDESSQLVLGLPEDKDRKHTHIRVVEKADGDMTLELLGASDQVLAESRVVSDGRYFGASAGDLNADGKPDFVVETTYDGCGLAAWNRTLVFAISMDDAYEISSVFTMFRDDCDLVDLDRDGRCELIHVAVLWSEEGDERDGRHHAYWVFHKLEIKDGRWVVSKKDGEFPKWVWYTLKPNQKATKRLTNEAKVRIWRERGGDAQIHWKPAANKPPVQASRSSCCRGCVPVSPFRGGAGLKRAADGCGRDENGRAVTRTGMA